MIESDTIENKKQLNIACKVDTLNRSVQKYEILNLANYILKFGGKKYAYFFFILDCGKTIQPVQKINAERLLQAIKNNEKLESCLPQVFMDSLLWFDSSMLYMKIYFYKHHLKLYYKLLNRKNIIEWRKKGLEIPASRYFIKKIQNKSTNKIRRVEAYIVLDIFEEGTYDEELINNIMRHTIKKIKKFKVKKIDFKGEIGIRRKPNYIWVRFYFHDKTLRELMFTGWKTKNLIFKVEWFSRWKNVGPIFIKNPHKIHRGIRIEYNPELIKNVVKDK